MRSWVRYGASADEQIMVTLVDTSLCERCRGQGVPRLVCLDCLSSLWLERELAGSPGECVVQAAAARPKRDTKANRHTAGSLREQAS